MTDQLFDTSDRIVSDASMSDDGRYRWSLSRVWDFHAPWLGWIMLNPSTADAETDDPTIRRCMGFARRWGYGGITVANLFALRATDPSELRRAENPIAPPGQVEMYDGVLLQIGTDAVCAKIIAAWGAHGSLHGRDRHVAQLYHDACAPLHCLGTNKDGSPCHPLYLPNNLEPVRFRMEGIDG